MARITLSTSIRNDKGKGAAKKLRKNNQIPAIFYGAKTEPVMLAVDYTDFQGIVKQSSGENIILGLQIKSDGKTYTKTAMLKELQMDPIKDTYLHVDFYEVSMDKEIAIDLPVHLVNTPLGVTKGGILQYVRRELTVSCLPDKLIERIDIDVSGLDIGESIHIRDIELPDGIKITQEGQLTVAVVVAPSVIPEEAEEEAVEEVEEEEGAEVETESD